MYTLTVYSLIAIRFSRKAQIIVDVRNETNNDPNISSGKWIPQNTLETPPNKPKKSNEQPTIFVDLENSNMVAIESKKVVWSDGNDESGA